MLLKTAKADAGFRQRRLIAALCDRSLFPHPVSRVEHLETHISHVLLAGSFAYKIKKPVNLGFLDFSDLHSRRHYCEEELRLNRRTAPALYLEVIPICGSENRPVWNGDGPAIEYALKMRRFSQDALLSNVLARGELGSDRIDALAEKIAVFHGEIERANKTTVFGEPWMIEQAARQNLNQLAQLLKSDFAVLDSARAFTERAHSRLAETFRHRKRDGFVRECHGDLHLNNISLFDGDIALFDCIEFNAELRWIDVMSEVAFVVMDLVARGRDDLGFRLLNAYLERTGDYAGLSVLSYYLAYRALVRAKVEALRDKEFETAGTEDRVRRYLLLAQRLAQAGRPAIIITHGLSGSGKTTLTQSPELKAIRVRSDLERKRLFGLPSSARTGTAIEEGLYSVATNADTYAALERLARAVAEAGFPAIVDAAFLKRAQRSRFQKLAAALDVPFVILDCRAPETVLRARVAERTRRGGDPSDADLAVLEHQLATREPLSSDELSSTVVFDSGNNWRQQLFALKSRLGLRDEARETIGNL